MAVPPIPSRPESATDAVQSTPQPTWNFGVGVDWARSEAALLTTELSSLLGGKTPKTSEHFRLTLFTEWLRERPTWHVSGFQPSLTVGYRKVELASVTLKQVNDSLFPGLSALLGDALAELDGVPGVDELSERSRDVGNNHISSAIHMSELYFDIGGTWLEKFPRFSFGRDAAVNVLELGIGVALHLSGLAVRTEKGTKSGVARGFGWGGELSASLALLSIESPASRWMIKPVVFEARIAGVFADGDFFGVFASAAVQTQLARYF